MAGTTTKVVNRDGSTSYRARYRDAAGRQHERRFRRKVDAALWLDGETARVVTGTHVAPRAGRQPFSTVAASWERDHLQHLKPSTALRYRGLLARHVLPAFGTVPLDGLRHDDVARWAATLSREGLSPSSVRAAHRVLSLVLDSAVSSRSLAANPAAKVRLPRVVRPEPRFLDRTEVAALAATAGADGDVIRFLALTGLRFGEMVGLKVGRVDLPRLRVEVTEAVTQVNGVLTTGPPKTHQRRSVPLAPSLVEPLALRCAGKDPAAYVFTSPQGGPLRLDNWRRRVFDPAARAAGLADVSPHDLRHTAASLAVSAGANVKAVQRMLGHASAAMTLDVYAGLFEEDLDTLGARLDGVDV